MNNWGCRSMVGLRSPKPPMGVRFSPPSQIVLTMKKEIQFDQNKRYVFLFFSVLILIMSVIFLRDYFGVLSLGLLTVMVYNPVYRFFLKVFKRSNIATFFVITTIFVSLILPIFIVGMIGFFQIRSIASDFLITNNEGNLNIEEIKSFTRSKLNSVLESIPYVTYRVSDEDVDKFITNAYENSGQLLLSFITPVAQQIPTIIANLILYVILLAYLFPNQDKLRERFIEVSPFEKKIDEKYITRTTAMAKSMVNGTFIVAFVQSAIAMITLLILDVPYVALLTLLYFVACVIPVLGGFVVTIPIAVIMFFSGNIVGAIFLILVQTFVISIIDNVLRPKLVSKESKLPEFLTLLGIMAGLSFFGPLGFIYGPIVMIVVVTTLEIYAAQYSKKIR